MAKPIFDKMAERGFPKKFCTASTKRPLASKIGNFIWREVEDNEKAKQGVAAGTYAWPAESAYTDNVEQWLKALEKSSQKKNRLTRR